MIFHVRNDSSNYGRLEKWYRRAKEVEQTTRRSNAAGPARISQDFTAPIGDGYKRIGNVAIFLAPSRSSVVASVDPSFTVKTVNCGAPRI
jgi:hypothetical protein